MLVEVALPVPVPRTFTYESESPIEPGTRVRVHFSGRTLTGWVLGPATDTGKLKQIRPIDKVLENEPSVPADLLDLCRWIADYYLAPVGFVLRAALPVLLTGGKRAEEPVKHRKIVRLTRELPSLQQREDLFGRAVRQRELFEAIEGMSGTAELGHLVSQL